MRPRSVDYALYAIVAECLLSVVAALTWFGQRGWIIAEWRKNNTYPNASDQTLRHNFSSFTSSTLITSIVMALVLLFAAKLIRDGKNWARWMYVVLTVVPILPGLPTAYLLTITNFLVNVPAAYRILSGCTGLAALAALVFLFLGTSRPYFRKPGAVAGSSPFAALLRPRTAKPGVTQPAAKPTAQAPAARAVRTKKRGVEETATVTVAASPAQARAPQPKRTAPRSKSRKAAE